ncbi:LysE family translocator [Virgisporangium aurantiacum]|uniref:Threonine transporter RhtB n=1 Tax=Virgisporangium aurantiacum TaxID=175570 RepID=A0A8J3ZFS9_9ACTN|nr:LysE family translocator [Virgisporangium aurantiacum]GIJ60800.1 threonine transporter RhtB [Virgisporangium aurantiacum]
MDLVALMPAFILAVLLISASPGPAMALIFRRAALAGFSGAVPTVLGLELGLYVWAVCAAAGLAAIVAASQVAFVVLRVVGAAFLVYLGVRAWRTAWRGGGPEPSAEASRAGWGKAFGEGTLVQLANPKAAVFMVAFYPQFVPADRPLFATTALLALVQVAIEIVFYLSLAALVGRAGTWFRRTTVRRRLEAVSGTILIALGLRLATTTR